MNPEHEAILNCLRKQRGFDYTAYEPEVLERRLIDHLRSRPEHRDAAACLRRLETDPAEADRLIDALTISVSRFFRDPLTFEYLAQVVLPSIIVRKRAAGDASLRIWSAGCATGEEAYSLAILSQELRRNLRAPFLLVLFGTDIDPVVLRTAEAGSYGEASLAEVRLGLLRRYFLPQDGRYQVAPEIRRLVTFARHDLLDPRNPFPTESVFGHFDLVLCCNVLLYMVRISQSTVVQRLRRSLAPQGRLVLGRVERLPEGQASRFLRETPFCPVYLKR